MPSKEVIGSDYYIIRVLDSEKMRTIPERHASVTVTGGLEEWILEFTILVE